MYIERERDVAIGQGEFLRIRTYFSSFSLVDLAYFNLFNIY